MAKTRGPLDRLADILKDKLSEVLGALAPQPDAIPIPVRNDPRDRHR
ncbi:hypothetical protein [Jannaschia formosa]|nr:hypothetical protein [Jannaschia formosa]